MTLFPREKTFAAYELQDCNPQDNIDEYRDYHIRDVRRLEISAQRRATDYLSMMIEELTKPDDSNGIMIGRCIHLDTRAVVGAEMKQTQLQHLDLAINVYEDETRAMRMKDSLQNGRVLDATYRTHLYRIEGIPFPALFGFAERFLLSRVLLREWVHDAMGAEFASAIAVS